MIFIQFINFRLNTMIYFEYSIIYTVEIRYVEADGSMNIIFLHGLR